VSKRLPLNERFWSKVDIRGEGDCWEWQAAMASGRYGYFAVSNGDMQYAHRLAWTLVNGLIPSGLRVLHKCDNPPCCNPAHLFLGSQQDNVNDMLQKQRGRWRRGETHHSAKLNPRKVRTIRSAVRNKLFSRAELAEIYGVSEVNIDRVVNRKIWRHVTDETA
jgi:hypothetical protein